jgi:hypothetical protein
MPSRTGARWSDAEAQELAKTFTAGGSIAQLARVHNRTQFAVEAQLERQGLWDRAERRPTGRAVGDHPVRDASAASEPVNAGRRLGTAPVGDAGDGSGLGHASPEIRPIPRRADRD